jgi:hypothetical protein
MIRWVRSALDGYVNTLNETGIIHEGMVFALHVDANCQSRNVANQLDFFR